MSDSAIREALEAQRLALVAAAEGDLNRAVALLCAAVGALIAALSRRSLR